MKEIILRFSDEVKALCAELIERAAKTKIERSIVKAIDEKKGWIQNDWHYGNPIAKILIPDEYRIKYGAMNLFRVELPNFWRMLYSVRDYDDKTEIIVVDILDHKSYNKKFGYKD